METPIERPTSPVIKGALADEQKNDLEKEKDDLKQKEIVSKSTYGAKSEDDEPEGELEPGSSSNKISKTLRNPTTQLQPPTSSLPSAGVSDKQVVKLPSVSASVSASTPSSSSSEVTTLSPEQVAEKVKEWENDKDTKDMLVKGYEFGLVDGDYFKYFYMLEQTNESLRFQFNWELARLPCSSLVCSSPRFRDGLFLHTKEKEEFNFTSAHDITLLYIWIRKYLVRKLTIVAEKAFNNNHPFELVKDKKHWSMANIYKNLKKAYEVFETELNSYYQEIDMYYGSVGELSALHLSKKESASASASTPSVTVDEGMSRETADTFKSCLASVDKAVKFCWTQIMNTWEFFFWKVINLISAIEYMEYCSLLLDDKEGMNVIKRMVPGEKSEDEYKKVLAFERSKATESVKIKDKFLNQDLFGENIMGKKFARLVKKVEQFGTAHVRFLTNMDKSEAVYAKIIEDAIDAHREAVSYVKENFEKYQDVYNTPGDKNDPSYDAYSSDVLEKDIEFKSDAPVSPNIPT